jgi:hypothetical protein
MQQTSSESPLPEPHLPVTSEPKGHGWRTLKPRLGISSHLALGLAAVTVVILVGHELAARTTSQATEAVRRMQSESEPLARRANAVLDNLVAYDRTISEYLEAGRSSDLHSITEAGKALESAASVYYESKPSPALTPGALELRIQLTHHIDKGEQFAKSAGQRAQWVEERNAALERVYHYIASAGGAGMAINGNQVVAQRSLSELEIAINAIRGNFTSGPAMTRKEQDFATTLAAHTIELQHSPGKAWLDLVRESFVTATHLRLAPICGWPSSTSMRLMGPPVVSYSKIAQT